ncbi:mechanosensitive channel of small conductance-like 10 [Actinidia rufa]|uniref:Mechanosensitive channel of small conductance-like 10 n=1 Tax=Actinidia rufa TaxID=165716 RepID=A0A7J0DXZ8_9ERIC|nr:mechanosensitive channel of small conductance-like 10 [Actinidia rufa]
MLVLLKKTVKTASVTPKTPLLASTGGEEEEDDEDVYNYKTPYKKSESYNLEFGSLEMVCASVGNFLWTVDGENFIWRPSLMKCEENVGNTNSGRLSYKNPKKDKGDKGEVNVEKLQKMKQEKISAWTMRGLIQVIQGSGLYTISNALEDCVDDECIEQKDKEITSEWEAKATASQIFENVARPGCKYIDEEDLLRFMKKEEVDNVLQLFEGETETRKIKKSSLKKWVVYVYNERKFLMVVEEMNILTTIFLRYDNEKIFYPNSVLATKPISNFYRSPEMSDAVEFAIDVSTSAQDIVDLKAKIKAYLEGKPQHWRPIHSVQVKDIQDVNKMKMALYVTHTMNFQNFVEKSNRRSELVLELKRIFEELKIKYNLLPQEVHLRYVGSAPPTPTNAKQC